MMTPQELTEIEDTPGYMEYALDVMLTHPDDYGLEEEADSGFLETYPADCYRDLAFDDRVAIASAFTA